MSIISGKLGISIIGRTSPAKTYPAPMTHTFWWMPKKADGPIIKRPKLSKNIPKMIRERLRTTCMYGITRPLQR